MRRIGKGLMAIGVLLLGAGMLLGQQAPPAQGALGLNHGLLSIEARTTGGVFSNELDAALNARSTSAGPAFLELTGNYLLFGLANLDRVQSGVGSASDPLSLGYYRAGDRQWSALAQIFNAERDDADTSEVEEDTASDTVVDGDTTTTEFYVEQRTESDYRGRLFDTFDGNAQFLIGLGDITTGLYLELSRDWNDIPVSAIGTSTEENFHDVSGGAELPSPQLNYTVEREFSDYTDPDPTDDTVEGGLDTMIGLAVPLELPAEDMRHFANLGLSLTMTNTSTREVETWGVPALDDGDFPTNDFDNLDNETTAISRTIGVDLLYEAAMSPLFDGHEDNEVLAGVSLEPGISSGTFTLRNETDSFEFAAPGDSAERTGRTLFEAEADIDTGIPLGASVWAEHAFYYDFGDSARFGVRPRGSLSMTLGANTLGISGASLTATSFDEDNVEDGRREIDMEFGDGIGIDDFTAYDPDPITGDPFEIVDIGGDPDVNAVQSRERTTTLMGTVTLPVGFTFEPEDLPFSFILGSTPRVSFTRTSTRTEIGEAVITVSDYDADNELTNREIERQRIGEESTSVEHSLSAAATHLLALRIQPLENATLDIEMQTSNFWQFGNLRLQAIVQL